MNVNTVKNTINRMKPREITLWNYGEGKVDLPGYTLYFHKNGVWYYGNSCKQNELTVEQSKIVRRNRLKLNGKEEENKIVDYRNFYQDNYWDSVCDAYVSGKPVNEISEEYGVSKVSIYRHLKIRQIPKHTTKGPGGSKKKKLDTGVYI